MSNKNIPVIMYHSVGIPNKKWHWNFLTCPWMIFEDQMQWIKSNGYTTIHLDDLYSFIYAGKNLPDKPIVLTFDDGYLDNYVFAYPLLKKYGLKGTIFINPEFVDPRLIKRKIFDQTDDISKLETDGFLSWEEIEEMFADNIFDFQSHALTHTWYPISNEIVDFRHPDDNYIWMTWNDNIDKKPYLQTEDQRLIELGAPVYKYSKSLSAPRYFPDDKLKDFLLTFVRENGGKLFFGNADWQNILYQKVEEFRANNEIIDRVETENEYYERIKHELTSSKNILENRLKKKVDFLCWPGGSGTKVGIELSKIIGYKMTTAAKDLSKQSRRKIKNNPSKPCSRISRISPIYYESLNKNGGIDVTYSESRIYGMKIKSFENNFIKSFMWKSLFYLFAFISKLNNKLIK